MFTPTHYYNNTENVPSKEVVKPSSSLGASSVPIQGYVFTRATLLD